MKPHLRLFAALPPTHTAPPEWNRYVPFTLFLHDDRWTMPTKGGFRGLEVAVLLRKPPKYEVMLPQIVEMAEAWSDVDLISRALCIGAEVVRDALHLHRTGKRPPARVDGRRRQPRQPGKLAAAPSYVPTTSRTVTRPPLQRARAASPCVHRTGGATNRGRLNERPAGDDSGTAS